ncbi:HK97-gp10 family putative phage morphogenesis protein [Marinobacter adhaerens]|uniref:HK97-gp10 family putative phage morphogenesis protein n=1 Tax=Marinobacter adhaerens TaxID=1033846 RepID=UPI0035CFA760
MATDGVNYKFDGLPELLGKLDGLEYDLKRKGGRFALRRAAQVIRDQARSNADQVDDSRSPEKISENIVERWSGRTFRKKGNMMFRVGVMGGAGGSADSSALEGNPGGDTRHWRQLEFGNENMAAQPIFRPVPQQAGQQAVDVFANEYTKKIDRALKRARKRAGVK